MSVLKGRKQFRFFNKVGTFEFETSKTIYKRGDYNVNDSTEVLESEERKAEAMKKALKPSMTAFQKELKKLYDSGVSQEDLQYLASCKIDYETGKLDERYDNFII